jgi:hypothetical protein
MGRLTLRKFYLLLAEWWEQQRREDSRVYQMLSPYLPKDDPPTLADLFFSYRTANRLKTQPSSPMDAHDNFRAVAAAMGAVTG